jgi:RNA-directed DNA polymerase
MSIIRYADDFVFIHRDKDIVEKAQTVISDWLAEVGLELKPSKTRIAHTIENLDGKAGFDFLGCEIGQYRDETANLGHKTIIKPSKDEAKRHLAKVGEVIERHKGTNQIPLISKLNPIIKG